MSVEPAKWQKLLRLIFVDQFLCLSDTIPAMMTVEQSLLISPTFNMQQRDKELDIILGILEKAREAYPGSVFVNSLLAQYRERGSLSKKQLEGLLGKVSKIRTINPAWLATLQAIILKKPSKHRSAVTINIIDKPDEQSAAMIRDILQKYPGHKRVLYFKMKMEKNEGLSAVDKQELAKFHKLII